MAFDCVTGRPPSVIAWGHQCAVYVGIMVVEKVLITGLLALQFWSHVRDLILAPITDPQVRVVIVVLVIPFFVNVSVPSIHFGMPNTCKPVWDFVLV